MTDYNELVKCGECKFWSETEKGFGRCLKSGFKTPKDFLGEDGERKDQGMTDYTKLVEALRHCNGLSFLTCRECQYNNDMLSCDYRMLRDAADAIEALQAEVRLETNKTVEYWNGFHDGQKSYEGIYGKPSEQQLPKRGHWEPVPDAEGRPYKYVCSNCHLFHVNEDEWYGYCPHCGAKMEAQDGK